MVLNYLRDQHQVDLWVKWLTNFSTKKTMKSPPLGENGDPVLRGDAFFGALGYSPVRINQALEGMQ